MMCTVCVHAGMLQVKSRTASGKEKFIADSAAEEREIPERMMACKGCECNFVSG